MKNIEIKTQIPKIIHLCWLSGDTYPLLIDNCIKSWQEYMPEYKIILWDAAKFEREIDNRFAREAYNCRKWAFVADYIRLYALSKYGGIYLDSDVRVYKSFDCFLEHGFFSCIEYFKPTNYVAIEAAIMGAKPNHPFVNECLALYDNIPFILNNGVVDQTTITKRIAEIACLNWGFEYKPIKQILHNDTVIYPPYVFTNPSGEFSKHNTYAIHLCNGSWIDYKPSLLHRVTNFLKRYWNKPYIIFDNIYKKIKSLILR